MAVTTPSMQKGTLMSSKAGRSYRNEPHRKQKATARHPGGDPGLDDASEDYSFTMKYFASGWWTMIALVDCSGSSMYSSERARPIRSGRSIWKICR